MNIVGQVAEKLNLRWAWEKAKNLSYPGDVWIDEIELSEFELRLEENLESIANDIRNGIYHPKPIKPMPFPKHKDDDGNERIRQYFRVSIRDQVAWIALVNIVGPLLDWAIPRWSYGNRLYRSIWIEEEEGGRRSRKVGRYRNSSGKLYLPFKQSWPIFKRHVYLTTRVLSKSSGREYFSEEDQEEFDFSLDAPNFSCQYLFEGWWSSKAKEQKGLYWCSIDLEKFFPSLKRDEVIRNIVSFVPRDEKASVEKLIKKLFNFKIDRSELTDNDLVNLGLGKNIKTYNHIPTGLFVSGFLSNAGMIRVDRHADREVQRRKTVAHFRYVDDHIFVSSSFDELISWLDHYTDILNSMNIGAKINKDKFEPKELGEFISARSKKRSEKAISSARKNAEEACSVDPDFPSPLMTKTLSLVSSIGRTDFNFLEDVEIDSTLNQLEHLLLVDLPETEIPEKTRLAFSAAKLAQIAQIQLEELEVNKVESESISQVDFFDRGRQGVYSPVYRIFLLIVKVLRRRPDRVRLWTRAIVLCRQTGVDGLPEILGEIEKIKDVNKLCHYYLMANFLTVTSSNLVIASSVFNDEKISGIKRRAALEFIKNSVSIRISEDRDYEIRHELRVSLKQFYLSMYVAVSMLEDGAMRGVDWVLKSKEMLKRRFSSLFGEDLSVGWVWWIAKAFLKDMRSSPNNISISLSDRIGKINDKYLFWRFFPGFVPKEALLEIVSNHKKIGFKDKDQGWLLESVRGLGKEIIEEVGKLSATRRIYNNFNKKGVDLYRWVGFCREVQSKNPYDPRVGEWTSLEIIRQCVEILNVGFDLDEDYLNTTFLEVGTDQKVHPANIIIPDSWIEFDSYGWESWFNLVRGEKIRFVDDDCIVLDSRYHPSFDALEDFSLSRALGLILYGLIRKDFSIPSLWGGLGHEDVLKKLPSVLLNEITFSTITLGFLEGCLNPRVLENILYESYAHKAHMFDDDRNSDPINFIAMDEILEAVELSQRSLVEFQESLSSKKAAQVTPIDAELLTKVSWVDVFNVEE